MKYRVINPDRYRQLMKIIDLTMKISAAIPVFPGSPHPSFVPWTKLDTHGYDSESIFMSTHTGTHMDAPSHFVQGRASIDEIPASRFVSSAILVRARKRAGELVEAQDFEAEEIRAGDAVVLATGWEKRSGKRNYMTENPGLAAGAARYLAKKKINLVAIDGPSIDAGSNSRFTAHKILLARNVLAVENLCNLGRIAKKRFTLVVAPLKLNRATGSPVRALALT
ncbi:MAG: cyclase family protein [Nitrososphaera sp.]|nr:cyclase family protein [Nitrososphaera sp.]